ncbi:MAG: ornithine cyclodeaminase [Acidimicrobiia bacterium]|nr:ornithine cyclodeaminase [Acidimicrobiia bacterium]
MRSIPFLDSTAVAGLAPYGKLVDHLYRSHLDPPAHVRRVVYSPPGSKEVFMGLPAWQPGDSLGVKLVTVFPDNPVSGIPSVQAVYVLFDGADGKPLAIMDGTELTYRKTSSDSALGSRLLSRPDSRTMLMVGAGGLAPHLIAAHREVRPSLRRVLIWNRTRSKAEELAEAVGGEVADNLDEAVSAADIISTATMTIEPLIKGELLRPGTHLDLVGAFLPHCREVDDEVIRRATIFVDSRDAAVHECGDLVIPLGSGLITEENIRADLFELCRGRRPGREDRTQITMYENGGGGHLDLMTAAFIRSHIAGL